MNRKPPASKPITSLELAKLCNVSQGTVDRALNNRSGISEATRQKILRAAQETGYIKNLRARSLVKGRSMLLGLILFDLRNEFFAELATQVEAHARSLGYSVLIVLTDKDAKAEQDCVRRLCGMGVDGMILFPVSRREEIEPLLATCGKPVVTVGNRLSENYDFIGPNDKAAMADAANFVLQKGYESLLYVCPALAQGDACNLYGQQERLQGFLSSVKQHPSVSYRIISSKDYLSALTAIDFSSEPRTAIICPSDSYAIKLLRALQEQGVAVPQEVGIMGFDHITLSRYTTPPLTTVDYPMREIGACCAQQLIGKIEGEIRQGDRLFPHQIVLGGSL